MDGGGVNQEKLRQLVSECRGGRRENSKSWIFDCPKCGKADKLYMFKGSGRFVCWVCRETSGFAGRPEFAFAELLGRPVCELRIALYGMQIPQAEVRLEAHLRDFFGDEDEPDADAAELVPVHWPIDAYPLDHRFAKVGVEYLAGRGIPLDVATRYGIRYMPPARRILFPISAGGVLYGWQGRATFKTEHEDPETGDVVSTPKAVTTKGLRRDHVLIFADRLAGSDHVVLSEGPVDAIKADLCGGNVGSLGKAVSAVQVGLLRNAGVRRLYLGLDPDAAREVQRLLGDFTDVECFQLLPPPGRGDLGECTFSEVKEAFMSARRIYAGQSMGHLDDFGSARMRYLKREARAGFRVS